MAAHTRRHQQELPQRIRARIHEHESGCWLWTGHIQPTGYAMAYWDGRMRYAHRILYEFFVGPIPPGLEIDHLCRVTRCVNPAHLEAVTHAENILRASGRTKTHCKHGHEWLPGSFQVTPKGAKRCRICNRDVTRRRYYAKRGQVPPGDV